MKFQQLEDMAITIAQAYHPSMVASVYLPDDQALTEVKFSLAKDNVIYNEMVMISKADKFKEGGVYEILENTAKNLLDIVYPPKMYSNADDIKWGPPSGKIDGGVVYQGNMNAAAPSKKSILYGITPVKYEASNEPPKHKLKAPKSMEDLYNYDYQESQKEPMGIDFDSFKAAKEEMLKSLETMNKQAPKIQENLIYKESPVEWVKSFYTEPLKVKK